MQFDSKYVVEYVKGFSNEEGPMMHPKIYTIDFPMKQDQVYTIRQKLREEEQEAVGTRKSDGRWVYLFFKYMTKELNNNSQIRVDLAVDSGGQAFSAV